MLLFISIICIVIHTVCALRRLEPVLQAIGEGREMPVRVSLAFCIGSIAAVVAWAYVLSEIVEGLYV